MLQTFNFEPFIPVPVVTELSPREGWAAFAAAVRGHDAHAQVRGETPPVETGGRSVAKAVLDELGLLRQHAAAGPG